MIRKPNVLKIENLAYCYETGADHLPTLVFLSGFRSDMNGTKAQYLADKAFARGQSYLLLDYSGHGASGGRFEDGSIGQWTKDALKIIDSVTTGPLLLVGSSMGGWIALQIALQRKERIAGLTGIAAAPDFTRSIQKRLSPEQAAMMKENGFIAVPSEYGDDLIITRHLIDEGEEQCVLDKELNFEFPVMLVQGKCDMEVPWQTAEKIKQVVTGTIVEIQYIEDGDHRLSRLEDLELIDAGVAALVRRSSCPIG